MVIAIDNFFGCYLLYCTNPKYKGKTYIGFTVNPERRIIQHNAGKHKGGAWKTSGRGPWDMALIVHGFPSDIAALRFEWAWQNPNRSRRLKHVTGKCRKESAFQFRVRVMCSMLSQTPWKRLPLTIRWLKQDYAMDLNPIPPMHMPIAYGPVTAKKKKHKSNEKHNFESKSNMSKTVNDKDMTATEHSDDSDAECIPLIERLMKKSGKISHEKDKLLVCSICENMVASDICVSCLNDSCEMLCHLQCLAKHCLANQNFMLVPVDTVCPLCKHQFLWGDLIRKTQGFHQYLNNENV